MRTEKWLSPIGYLCALFFTLADLVTVLDLPFRPSTKDGTKLTHRAHARVGKAARCRARCSLSLEAVKKDASRIDELDHQTFAESKLTRKSNRLRNPLKKTNRHPDL